MEVTEKHTKSTAVFNISGKTLACYILPLPSVGFLLCVILSLIYDFKSSTATHCGVRT